MTAFEDGLWERLVEEHDADCVSITAPRQRNNQRPVIICGSVTGLAAVTAAAVVGIGAATTAAPAYAMTQNADGSITVTINDLATAIPELNAKLAQMGVDTTIVPVTGNCPDTGNIGDELLLDPRASGSETITLGTRNEPGYTGVVAAEQLPGGHVAMAMEEIKPPIPTCFPTTAYQLVPAGETNNGVPIYKSQAVTPTDTSPSQTTTGN